MAILLEQNVICFDHTDTIRKGEKPISDQTSMIERAYQLAAEMFPAAHQITRAQIIEIKNERKGRKKIIQALQERILGTPREEYKILSKQLKDLQLQQSAANINIKRYHNRLKFN